VSWGYYVAEGTQPDGDNDAATCVEKPQRTGTPEIWNPLPWFQTVRQDRELADIQTISHFFEAARNGALPAVSWVVPNGRVSEHPPALVGGSTQPPMAVPTAGRTCAKTPASWATWPWISTSARRPGRR
jgi:phospholipase C